MPYDVSWYDEDRLVIRVDVHGEATWEGWYNSTEDIVALLNEVSHSADLMYVERTERPKGNPLPYVPMGFEKLWAQPQLGRVVVVAQPGVGLMLRVVVDSILRAFRIPRRRQAQYFRTVDAALEYLQTKREENGAHA